MKAVKVVVYRDWEKQKSTVFFEKKWCRSSNIFKERVQLLTIKRVELS
jgi:hypothetical protein